MSVLLVEEDPQGAKLLRSVLEQGGAQVSIASSAAEAITRTAELAPHLVVLDMVLPDEHGLEVIEALKPRIARGEISVVVISSIGGWDAEREVGATGGVAYYRKPIETSTFAATLAAYVKKS